MRCGIAVLDDEGRESELDYEPVGLLGPNLDLYDLAQVASLNYLCDDYGLDTISAGSVLGFYADAIEQGAVEGDLRFGDAEGMKRVLGQIAHREGEIGNLLAEGTLRAARAFGHGSEAYAMQVKGLEISAYNCKFIPGMALAFGVSPIGAHHKESWIITYEVQADRARVVRAGQGPEGRRPPADPGRPVRVDRHLPLPVGRARLGRGALPDLLQHDHRQGLDARGLLADLGPDLRAHQAVLAARVPGDGPHGRLRAGHLVRPGQRRHGGPDRRHAPRAATSTTSCSATTTTSGATMRAACPPGPPSRASGSTRRPRRRRPTRRSART